MPVPVQFKELVAQTFEEHLGRKLGTVLEIGSDSGILFGEAKRHSKVSKIVYLTRGEVATQLQISLPTLHNYTKEGLIKSYRIGGKVRYKAEDIEQALKERNFTAVHRKGGSNAA